MNEGEEAARAPSNSGWSNSSRPSQGGREGTATLQVQRPGFRPPVWYRRHQRSIPAANCWAASASPLPRSPDVQQQFVREAERLHQLRHPHVVALYGVALSGPKGILLME